jgi:hypothetical protein
VFLGRIGVVKTPIPAIQAPAAARWRELFWLGLLSAANGTMVLWLSTFTGFWTDEDFSYQAVAKSWAGMFAFLRDDVHPPLYFILVKLWHGATAYMGDEASLRSFSALCAVAALWVYFALFRRLDPKGTAPWIAVLMMAMSPCLTWYSGESRPYALLILVFGSAWLALLRFWERPESGVSTVALGIALAAVPYTHSVGLVGDLAFAAFVAWERASGRVDTAHWKGLRQAAALCLVLYLPYVPVLLHQMGLHHDYWIGRQHNPWTIWREYTCYYLSLEQSPASIYPWMAVLAFSLGVPGARGFLDRGYQVCLCTLLGWLVLPWAMSLVMTPFLIHRVALCAAPLLFFAVARRLQDLHVLAAWAALLWLALLAWPAQQLMANSYPEREDARAAASLIATSPFSQDPVLLWDNTGPYYFRKENLLLAGPSHLPGIEAYSWDDFAQMPASGPFWVVTRSDHFREKCPAPWLCPWDHVGQYHAARIATLGNNANVWFNLELWRLKRGPVPESR